MFCIVVHGASSQTKENLEKFDAKIRQIIRENFLYSNREEILIFFPAEILASGLYISINWIKYLDKKGKDKFTLDLLKAAEIFFPLPIKINLESKCYVHSKETLKSGMVITE